MAAFAECAAETADFTVELRKTVDRGGRISWHISVQSTSAARFVVRHQPPNRQSNTFNLSEGHEKLVGGGEREMHLHIVMEDASVSGREILRGTKEDELIHHSDAVPRQ